MLVTFWFKKSSRAWWKWFISFLQCSGPTRYMAARGVGEEDLRRPKGNPRAVCQPRTPRLIPNTQMVSVPFPCCQLCLCFSFSRSQGIRFDLVYKHVQQGAGGRPLESAPGPRHCPVSQIRRPGAKSCIIRVALQW